MKKINSKEIKINNKLSKDLNKENIDNIQSKKINIVTNNSTNSSNNISNTKKDNNNINNINDENEIRKNNNANSSINTDGKAIAKEIDNLSTSLEDYLEAIFIISSKKKVVRVKELAEFLKVTTPSVVDAVSKLEKKGLVSHEKYGYLSLTKDGVNLAKSIYSKHGYIYDFLNNFLGVDKINSQEDACGIEHHISNQTFEKLIKLMDFVKNNPEVYSDFLQKYNQYINNKKK